ncbi:MAG TPA: antibiotic biosynthesis monooxygenase family protein [Candidatus Limnocylindrales bacterium]|nr:antibiotic biosynthesis monooxygenase family protein [Candidatus Limnocylindrales bacterium]
MVIRILRTRVRPERVPEFRERALAKVADARRVPGVIDVHLGNQAEGTSERYVFISRWASIEALYAWAGGRDLLARPIYFEGLEDALLEFDIQHYVDVELALEP